ncbi:MAG: Na+/H+ antiporter NhaC [Eubacteriales bacterium]|nr:Na+/H+ antiporter NhaC [Eubacteriales bacterium]
MENNKKIQLSMNESIVLILLIVAEIVICVRSSINLEIPLFLTWLILWAFSKVRKLEWKTVEGYIFDGVRHGFQSIMIVAAVGLLIGTWILCGCIPTMIYYGLALVSPSIFLPATLILCSILSVMTGTSYGSAASAGLACMGIGISMGFPAGIVAGAVICGALFGDKMSPFSDTTNLAPAMAGSTLFGHIKAMFYTTLPSWIICLIVFAVIGSRYSTTGYDAATVAEYMGGLADNFNITPVNLIPIVFVIVVLLLKVPALPTILCGAVIGAVVAMGTQGASWIDCFDVMKKGFSIDSGIFLVDKLLNRGGIAGMYNIMMIMTFAMGMGNALDKMGVLSNLIGTLVKKINSLTKLVGITMLVSYLTDAIGCTQSMSHVVTGKLMNPIYREKGVDPRVLSRTMEDAGTLGGALIPWHTNAVYFAGTLGVLYSEYIPWVLLCYICPIIALVLAATGKFVWYIDPETGEEVPADKALINQK